VTVISFLIVPLLLPPSMKTTMTKTEFKDLSCTVLAELTDSLLLIGTVSMGYIICSVQPLPLLRMLLILSGSLWLPWFRKVSPIFSD